MTPLRFAALASVLCGTAVLAGGAVSELTGFDSPRIAKPNLAPIEDQRAASLSAKTGFVTANTESMDAPQPTPIDRTGTPDADPQGKTASLRARARTTATAWSARVAQGKPCCEPQPIPASQTACCTA
jgi:hypothetical protein